MSCPLISSKGFSIGCAPVNRSALCIARLSARVSSAVGSRSTIIAIVMSSLNDELDGEDRAAQNVAAPKARSEWDGSDGYIETGVVGSDFNPTDFDTLLRRFGHDPANVRVIKWGESKWEQRARNRETNEYETTLL